MKQQNQPEPGVVAHALQCLGAHIGKYQLPCPAEVAVADDHVQVYVRGVDAQAWRNSIPRVSATREAAPGGIEWITYVGLLPDSGVKVQLEWMRRATTRGRSARMAVAR